MIQWSGYEWMLQERWGQIHLEKPFVWYDPSAVNIDDNQFLHLKTHYNPKYFPNENITSDTGVGLVSCTNKFSHGVFEIEAKLPQGKYLWPAFWMWGWDSWPPEIDVFEGYSNKFSNYFSIKFNNKISIWNVATNVWFKNDNGKETFIKSKNGWFGFKDPSKHFIKYKLEWYPDIINIYYNNHLVRKVTDMKILEQLNGTTMNVILNNSISKPYSDSDSDFIVKYFTYQG